MRCGFVDDIIIGYTRIFIDGPGGVLASGGPLMSRGADWPVSRSLPVSGWIEVDSGEPLDSSYAQDVILHEMGHVLGFGTIFSDLKLLSPSNCEAQAELGDVPTPKFLGKAATAALPKIYYRNTSYPPIEGGVGPGTACVHWSERYLKHEIMTGFLSSSYANVISYLTAATFQDLGYTVNFASPNIDYKFNMSAPPGSRDDGTLVNITGCTKDSKSWKKFNPIPFNATEAGRRAALKDALAP